MYLLDTSVTSESRKLGTHRVDERAELWFSEIYVETNFVGNDHF